MLADPDPSEAALSTATGVFDVKIGLAGMMSAPPGAPPMERRSLDKRFRGDLQGASLGEMLSAGDPRAGTAAYTALESFTGTLQGRPGGFALAHFGLMQDGGQELRIVIAPGSGTGELVGIRGTLTLRIEAGVHHYTLRWALG